ncbi:hypothetical protein FQZ97_804850 [compost metagenome]
MLAAVVDELGAEHTAGAHALAIGLQAFIDHAEAVALAQVAAEVDIAGEHLGQLHGDWVGDVGRVGGGEQGAADHATGQAGRSGEVAGFEP